MPVVVCSECETKMKVPDGVLGKKIRCKSCSAVFVAEEGRDREAEAADDGPIKMAPTEEKPKPKKAKAPAVAKAAPKVGLSKQQQRDAEALEADSNPYILNTDEDDSIPRCPFCAKELPYENARICLNCGYDTVLRSRNQTKAVYQPTFGEWFMHLLPGIIGVLSIIGLVAMCIVIHYNIKDWLVGTFMEAEGSKKEERKWMVKPGIFTLWASMAATYMSWRIGKMTYNRLVANTRPTEKSIKEE